MIIIVIAAVVIAIAAITFFGMKHYQEFLSPGWHEYEGEKKYRLADEAAFAVGSEYRSFPAF